MSKTALAGAEKYFRTVLDELRAEWMPATTPQRMVIETKAAEVQVYLRDVKARLDKLASA